MFHFRGRRCLFPFNSVRLNYSKNSKENNSVMYRLWRSSSARTNWKLEEVSYFTVKLQDFSFFCTGFLRNYAKIIPNLFHSLEKILLALSHSALSCMKSLLSKKLQNNVWALPNKWKIWWMLSSFWRTTCPAWCAACKCRNSSKNNPKQTPIHPSEKLVHQKSMNNCFKPKKRHFCAKSSH